MSASSSPSPGVRRAQEPLRLQEGDTLGRCVNSMVDDLIHGATRRVLNESEGIMGVVTKHLDALEENPRMQTRLESDPELKALWDGLKVGMLHEQSDRYDDLVATLQNPVGGWQAFATAGLGEQEETASAEEHEQQRSAEPTDYPLIHTDSPEETSQDVDDEGHDGERQAAPKTDEMQAIVEPKPSPQQPDNRDRPASQSSQVPTAAVHLPQQSDVMSGRAVSKQSHNNKENIPKNKTVTMPEPDHTYLDSVPGLAAVNLEDSLLVHLLSPVHPGMDSLVFRKGPSFPNNLATTHGFTSVGTDAKVASPGDHDTIIEYSAANLKRLLVLYEYIKSRKHSLFFQWQKLNKSKYGAVTMPKEAYHRDTGFSRALHDLAASDIPLDKWALDVVLPVRGRKGGIKDREIGTIVKRRVLLLRWEEWGEGSPPPVRAVYYDPSKDSNVRDDGPDDIIIPENEDTLKRLWALWNEILTVEDFAQKQTPTTGRPGFAPTKRQNDFAPEDERSPKKGRLGA